jgi:hypothetical protein
MGFIQEARRKADEAAGDVPTGAGRTGEGAAGGLMATGAGVASARGGAATGIGAVMAVRRLPRQSLRGAAAALGLDMRRSEACPA